MSEDKKVYCKDCIYFGPGCYEGIQYESTCKSPKNDGSQIGNWITTWYEKKLINNRPCDINRSNDCKWFEEKPE